MHQKKLFLKYSITIKTQSTIFSIKNLDDLTTILQNLYFYDSMTSFHDPKKSSPINLLWFHYMSWSFSTSLKIFFMISLCHFHDPFNQNHTKSFYNPTRFHLTSSCNDIRKYSNDPPTRPKLWCYNPPRSCYNPSILYHLALPYKSWYNPTRSYPNPARSCHDPTCTRQDLVMIVQDLVI